MVKKWSKEDLDFLFEHYPTAPLSFLEEHLQRSSQTIHQKACTLRKKGFSLKRDKEIAYEHRVRIYENAWSSEEESTLKALAQTSVSRAELVRLFKTIYPNRTRQAIHNKLKNTNTKLKSAQDKALKEGDMFNFWKVLSSKTINGKYECLCTACGITKQHQRAYSLKHGETKSCGCSKGEIQKKTNLEKYGVIHPMQKDEFQERARKTNLERYGVEYPSKRESVIKKMRTTMFNKYGIENYSQLPERRNKLKEWSDKNPGANRPNGPSKPEKEILAWIKTFYPSAKKYRKEGNELDIFIPELKLGIEHNGLYWHSDRHISNNYHLDKTKFFKEHKIRTIHIFEHEWRDSQEQVKSFIQSAIGKNTNKIGARKCEFLWVDSKKDKKEVRDFLDTYHIQGKCNFRYAVKVLYKGELIGCATFGMHHRNSTTWVLSRFCTKQDYTIQGGLAKISKLASKQIKQDMISWAHYRISDGNGYKKAGWEFEELMSPDYFYCKGNKAISKQSRQKKKVKTPNGMTEREHAILDGLSRVYDCGKIRYIYKYIKNNK